MPTYEYRCSKGHVFERTLPLKYYRVQQMCDCGAPSERYFSMPPMGFVQRECVYDSPRTGEPITSWAQRREDLARHHCQEYDPGMRQDADRFRHQQDDALDKAVEATVEEEIEKMPTPKREQLQNELDAGADVEYARLTPEK